jgi:fructokinase
MLSGTPTSDDVTLLIQTLYPELCVLSVTPLCGGLINTNLKVEFDRAPAVVLRIYRDGAAVCRKEVAVLNLLSGVVPVPHVLHSQPDGAGRFGAFAVLEYVEGITFQQLKQTADVAAINDAATSVGAVLASIGRFQFDKPGRLRANESGELEVGDAYTQTTDPTSEMLDLFLADPLLVRRVGQNLIGRLRSFVHSWAARMPNMSDDARLVHSDFGKRNILVKEEQGHWIVKAVLDWEFAFSGSPLLDVGHLLRYEKRETPLLEPFFSRAFVQHGGKLPDNWRKIARVIDLTALVEFLTHRDLPEDIKSELFELIQATLEDRDPVQPAVKQPIN